MKSLAEIGAEVGIDPEAGDARTAIAQRLSEDATDVDFNEWLSDVGGAAVDTVEISLGGVPRKLKIAVITEGEDNQILKMSRKPNPQGGRNAMGKPDFALYRRLIIAFSLNKAKGLQFASEGSVTPEQLVTRPVGELTKIQKAIFELSGMTADAADTPDPGDFFA